jgi:ribosomal protein S18 acetylase RimI-like enzyme
MSCIIRPAASNDREAIWRIMEPIIRGGETYSLPRDMSRDGALDHWFAPDRSVFVADEGGQIIGTYYLRANRLGPGAHVSNAGFMVSAKVGGKGVGQALCEHALATAKARGFAAMQFNFVVAANDRAVRLWQRMGFAEIGRAPDAFQHPRLGLVDALVMYRKL